MPLKPLFWVGIPPPTIEHAMGSRRPVQKNKEKNIRKLRKRTHNNMKATNTPRRLWEYFLVHQSKIRKFLPGYNLQGSTAMEHVTGNISEIPEYCDFYFYDLVWYHPGIHPKFNDENRTLGRWVGVSHRIVSDMCYWIIKKSGTVIAETTVQNVTRDDMLDAKTAAQVENF